MFRDPVIATVTLLLQLAQSPTAPALHSRTQALSEDGKLFAYSVSDGTVHIAALPEGKSIVVASGFAAMVNNLEFSPDGKQLASVERDGRVRIVACADGKLVSEFAAAPDVYPLHWPSCRIAFVDDGTKLLVAGLASKAGLIERRNGTLVREITVTPPKAAEDDRPTFTASAVSADSKHFALGDSTGRYAVFSAISGVLEKGPFEGPKYVNSLDFDPAGARLAIGGDDCRVRVHSLEENLPPLLLSLCDKDPFGDLSIGSVRFGHDGKTLLAASHYFWEVRLWDLEKQEVIWHYDYGGGTEWQISASFTKDQAFVVVSGMGTVLDAATGKEIRKLYKDPVFRDFCAMAGPYAWTFHDADRITILNPADGKTVCELPFATAK